MSKTFIIYGASDDLVEVEEVAGLFREEFSAYGPITLILSNGEGAARVRVGFDDWGCWSVGVGPVDEDLKIPPHWEFRLFAGTEVEKVPAYSMALFATVDNDVALTRDGAED